MAPRRFVVKQKIHCDRCERKLEKRLRDVEGVDSVEINAKQGTVTISGSVDPSAIVALLERATGKSKASQDNQCPLESPPKKELQIVTKSKSRSEADEGLDEKEMVRQLMQLSVIKGLKNVEVTYTKTIKLSFHGGGEDKSSENIAEIAAVHGGGICAASASCCGGHPGGDHTKYGNVKYGNWQDWTTPAWGVPPPGETPPSAPPLPPGYDRVGVSHEYPPPPPTMGYSYSSPFSDDNTTSYCTIA